MHLLFKIINLYKEINLYINKQGTYQAINRIEIYH